MSIICDGGLTNDIIDEFGETIYVYELLSRTYSDEYDTNEEVRKKYKLKAMFNYYTDTEEGVREGHYYSGQITFMIDTSFAYTFKAEDLVYYPVNDKWYEIDIIRRDSLAGVLYSVELTVKEKGQVGEIILQDTLDSWAKVVNP